MGDSLTSKGRTVKVGQVRLALEGRHPNLKVPVTTLSGSPTEGFRGSTEGVEHPLTLPQSPLTPKSEPLSSQCQPLNPKNGLLNLADDPLNLRVQAQNPQFSENSPKTDIFRRTKPQVRRIYQPQG